MGGEGGLERRGHVGGVGVDVGAGEEVHRLAEQLKRVATPFLILALLVAEVAATAADLDDDVAPRELEVDPGRTETGTATLDLTTPAVLRFRAARSTRNSSGPVSKPSRSNRCAAARAPAYGRNGHRSLEVVTDLRGARKDP